MSDAAPQPSLADLRFAEYQRLRRTMDREKARAAAMKLTAADFQARDLEREDLRMKAADANKAAIAQRRADYDAETEAGAYRNPDERALEQTRRQKEDETNLVSAPRAVRFREELTDEEKGASDITAQRRRENPTSTIDPADLARVQDMGGVAPGALPSDLRTGMNTKKTMLGKFNFLRHELGDGNVREALSEDGSRVVGLRWREDPSKPWKDVDPGINPERPFSSMLDDVGGDIADVLPAAAESAPGAIGAAAGEALGGIPGAVALGALGDVAGSYLRDTWSRGKPGAEAPDAEGTTGRDAAINVMAGAAGNALPLAGRFLKPGAGAIARQAAKQMPVDATAARKLAELAESGDVEAARNFDLRRPTTEMAGERAALGKRTGVDFSAAELSGSRDLLQQEDALSAINRHADKIGEARVRRTAQAEGYFRRAVKQIGGGAQDPGDVGKNVVKLRDAYLDSLIDARKAAVSPLFKEADAVLGDARLPVESLKQAITGVLDSMGETVTSESEAIRKMLMSQLGKLEGKQGLTASQLGDMLSVWGRAAAKGSKDVFGPDVSGRRVKGIAKVLFASLQDDLGRAAAGNANGAVDAVQRSALLLQEARSVFAEMSPAIDAVDNDILNSIVGLGESGKSDLVGGALLASKSPNQIRSAIQVLKTAGESIPEYQDVARQAIGDALATLVEGARAGNAERNQGVFTSMAKFASASYDKRGQINALLSGLPKGEERQAMAMWEDARRVAEILSDRGLPPGSPTASRLNAAEEATANVVKDAKRGGATGVIAGVAERKLNAPRLDAARLVSIATNIEERDAFLKLMAQQNTAGGRLISKTKEPRAYAEAWLRAATQIGIVSERDDFFGEATPKQFEQERPANRRPLASEGYPQ